MRSVKNTTFIASLVLILFYATVRGNTTSTVNLIRGKSKDITTAASESLVIKDSSGLIQTVSQTIDLNTVLNKSKSLSLSEVKNKIQAKLKNTAEIKSKYIPNVLPDPESNPFFDNKIEHAASLRFKTIQTPQFSEIYTQTFENPSLFVIKVDSCNSKSCGIRTAYCSDYQTCVCRKGFADLKHLSINKAENDENRLVCQYEQKKQFYAFSAELLGLGLGHLYLQNYLLFWLKYVYALCSLVFLIPYCTKNMDKAFACASYVYFIIFAAWYIADLLFIGTGLFKDKNGVPMAGF